MGFIISTKENEKRRALLPKQIFMIKNKKQLFFEKGYGEVLGYSDKDYVDQGAIICSKEEVLKKDIICDPKIGDADYLSLLQNNQMLFGYVHAVQNKDITNTIISGSLSAVAWEDMNEDGRHIFWRNNELAGEAAIMHALTIYGKMPYECKVALIGKGNIARGSFRIMSALGAEIVVYDRKMESLLRKEIADYDIIINCISWDTSRTDHIIYKKDLKRMKKHAMIIDVSCDRAGGIETSIPTNIENPTYVIEGILHYVVDHTPALIFHTASKGFSKVIVNYIDDMIEENIENNKVLLDAMIFDKGVILDERINNVQKRKILPVA